MQTKYPISAISKRPVNCTRTEVGPFITISAVPATVEKTTKTIHTIKRIIGRSNFLIICRDTFQDFVKLLIDQSTKSNAFTCSLFDNLKNCTAIEYPNGGKTAI